MKDRSAYISFFIFTVLILASGAASAQIAFDPATNITVGDLPDTAALGDFNKDGHLDIAVTSDNPDKVSVLLNQGNGTFGAPNNILLPSGSGAQFVVAGDLNENGDIDIEALKAAVGPNTAGIMMTNPSTLGVFERDVIEVDNIVKDAGGLLYYDGANLNAICGKVRPGDMGFDIMHYNLHKTFSTPHGGGGPGSGPVAVCRNLAQFLPVPVVVKDGDNYKLDYDRENSIGKVMASTETSVS